MEKIAGTLLKPVGAIPIGGNQRRRKLYCGHGFQAGFTCSQKWKKLPEKHPYLAGYPLQIRYICRPYNNGIYIVKMPFSNNPFF